jgi:hypothetical protein
MSADKLTRLCEELDTCTPEEVSFIIAHIERRRIKEELARAVCQAHADVARVGWHASIVDLGEVDGLVRLPETFALRLVSIRERAEDDAGSAAILLDVADDAEQVPWAVELGYVYPREAYLGSTEWSHGMDSDDGEVVWDDGDDGYSDVRTATVVRRVWIFCAPRPTECPPRGTRLVVFCAGTSSVEHWKVRTHGIYDADHELVFRADEWPSSSSSSSTGSSNDWHILRVKASRV